MLNDVENRVELVFLESYFFGEVMGGSLRTAGSVFSNQLISLV